MDHIDMLEEQFLRTKQISDKLTTQGFIWARLTARQFHATNGIEQEDLVAEAMHAFIKYLGTYEENKGLRLRSWIINGMRYHIMEVIRCKGTMPNTVLRKAGEVKKLLLQEQIKNPTVTFEAFLSDLPERYHCVKDWIPFNDTFNKKEKLFEAIPAPEKDDDSDTLELFNTITSLLNKLPPREEDILKKYFIETKSLRVIGEELGISESRTGKLKDNGIRRLRPLVNVEMNRGLKV